MPGTDPTESIALIRDSARAIAGAEGLKRARALRFGPSGYDRAVWRQICDLGWPALRLPEDRGGIGLGMAEYCALAEELGRALVPEPLIPAILAASLLDDATLPQHLSGDLLVLPAVLDGALGPHPTATLAAGAMASAVAGGGGADAFLIIGAQDVALVPRTSPDIAVTVQGTQDGGTIARVQLLRSPPSLRPADPAAALAEAALASAASMLGLMAVALEMTVAYLKTRVQFGKALAQFQVLQHMAVDLRLEMELTRAAVEDAARRWDAEGPAPATRAAIARSRVRAGQAALKVTRDAVQLHGGIGFTDEHDIGLYLRRAMVAATEFGTNAQHRALYRALKPLREEV